jgi:hypothetical protein
VNCLNVCHRSLLFLWRGSLAPNDNRGGLDHVRYADKVHSANEHSISLDHAEVKGSSPYEEVRWQGRVLRVPPVELARRIEVHRQRLDRVAAIDDYSVRGPSGPATAGR